MNWHNDRRGGPRLDLSLAYNTTYNEKIAKEISAFCIELTWRVLTFWYNVYRLKRKFFISNEIASITHFDFDFFLVRMGFRMTMI